MPLDELWVEVEDLPGYAVSNYGRVVDLNTNIDLMMFEDPNGYLMVLCWLHGKLYAIYIHRLVARAFFLNYEKNVSVRHINNNLRDNTVLNLSLGPRDPKKEKRVWE